jgi:2-haloacid dehalogenase
VTSQPAVLLFDVFGTVVDWRGSIIATGEELGPRIGTDVDWGSFASDWRREGYLRPIVEMFDGNRGRAPIDSLLADQLEVLLGRYGLSELADADRRWLLGVWRRLAPWPDAVGGLMRLKERYLIGPLSNGGFGLLTDMAKAARLPWDFVISAELFRAYKPSPEVYIGGARLLERSPEELMLVAAHPADLEAARQTGMQTAYVARPLEWGPETKAAAPDEVEEVFDVVARDFVELAEKLGA